MNYNGIIAASIALVGGVVIGATIINNNGTSPESFEFVRGQERAKLMNEQLPATDYVSMRPAVADLPNETLSQAELDGLLLMREEEKLARDVYQTLYERWGLSIFANIAQSEQTHTEAVRDLLVKYDIADPVTDDTIGVFVNNELQQLYNDLTQAGNDSEVAALTVGATIEDLDIKDLIDLSAATDNADIALVYDNLTRGSRNHLRAFTHQLSMRDASYEPQYISSAEYESIITSEQETGYGQRGGSQNGHSGRGWGGGKGGDNR
jgi:hypothetical protein